MDQSLATYSRLSQQVTDRGPWQQTGTGGAFFLADPRADEVMLEDVAQALSLQCRYNGHCTEFYSVAQHACMVAKWMEQDGHPVEAAYAGLHHDSAEAYTGDLVSQVKYVVPEIRAMEDRVEAAVNEAFRVQSGWRHLTKDYDMIALATEVRDFMPENKTEFSWGALPTPRDELLVSWTPDHAMMHFMIQHNRLCSLIEEKERNA